jgi:circadian clock protein KaiC
MTDTGIKLIDAYIGPEGVLTGTARIMQEARDQAAAAFHEQDIERRKRDFIRRRSGLERQIADLKAQLELEADEAQKLLAEEGGREAVRAHQRAVIKERRGAAQ